MWMTLLVPMLCAAATPEPHTPIHADRTWQILDEGSTQRERLALAGVALADWEIDVAGVTLNGARLVALAAADPEEPLVRVIREDFARAIDVEDFLYLLDDILVAGADGRRGEPFFVGAGRARSMGILVHPDDVFKNKPRVYPNKKNEIAVDEPLPQESFPPAVDGEGPGPNWTMRYRTPSEAAEMYETLSAARPEHTLASRVAALVSQLEQQGAEVYLTSFLRYRERGYLMWGAHELRSCDTEACVTTTAAKLDKARSWAPVSITWSHPDGWKATREAARQMADAFDVVYATEKGARYSKHYDGVAVDFVALGLPRELTLHAPDGAQQVFDLSDPEQTRDLSLSPALIDWVEDHFQLSKLRSDYPHWSDADR